MYRSTSAEALLGALVLPATIRFCSAFRGFSAVCPNVTVKNGCFPVSGDPHRGMSGNHARRVRSFDLSPFQIGGVLRRPTRTSPLFKEPCASSAPVEQAATTCVVIRWATPPCKRPPDRGRVGGELGGQMVESLPQFSVTWPYSGTSGRRCQLPE